MSNTQDIEDNQTVNPLQAAQDAIMKSDSTTKRKRGRPRRGDNSGRAMFSETGKMLVILPAEMREPFEEICKSHGMSRSGAARLGVALLIKKVEDNGGSIV
tara:strand:- start:22 stop:324 length:303 start_codon:yes stop_codon:yes gene_type:complete